MQNAGWGKKKKREKQRKCDRNASKQTYKINTKKKKNCSTLGVIYKEHKWIPYTRKSPSNFWVQHVPINLVNLLKITLFLFFNVLFLSSSNLTLVSSLFKVYNIP